MGSRVRLQGMVHDLVLARIAIVVLLLFCAPSLTIADSDTFDVPLDKQVVDYGLSPYQPGGNARIKLSCYSYTNFMIEEFDLGQEGAEWWEIVPIQEGAKPACKPSHTPDVKIIGPKEWEGYFKCVSGGLVFLDAADGANGGMQFAVYDVRTGARIFEDSYYDERMWKKQVGNSSFGRLRLRHPANQTTLVYLRVAVTDCDLHLEKTSCWKHVRKQFGVRSATVPVCNGYAGITNHRDSAFAYPVEVSLTPKPTSEIIDGPVKCWPVD